ncbi:hypothetical protein TTRE_0000202001 [Trichuris trichiura]|uniref:Uncharacterized protein n=1 Tax=Trichuris trichiura TaxID=36087 RepID=A0A077Z224_TRITR|nr:hypothetical protein TTRE_0000202001 [Trichuris trichiura]
MEASGEFWYYFSEVLYQTSEDAQNANAFRAFVARLMSMFFLFIFQDGVPPDLSDFEEFRLKVSEIIKDVVFIIGSNKLLEQLMQDKQGWENIECALFLMSCVVGNSVDPKARFPYKFGIVSLEQDVPLALWYTSAVFIYEAVSKCIESNVKNSTVAERSCRALRYLIRSLGVHSLPLLEGLATKVFTFYQMTTHSCFLYLASILVDEFGADQRFVPGFLQMLQVLVPHAFKKEVANTVEDLYRLGMRSVFAKRAPLQMFAADFFPPLLINAIEALKLDDLEAFESDIKFLDELLTNIVRIGKVGSSFGWDSEK